MSTFVERLILVVQKLHYNKTSIGDHSFLHRLGKEAENIWEGLMLFINRPTNRGLYKFIFPDGGHVFCLDYSFENIKFEPPYFYAIIV